MEPEGHRAVPGVDAGNHAGEQLVLFGAELVVDHPLFRLPDALDDDLPGGLGGDAAEGPCLDLYAHRVAQLGLGQGAAGLLQADLHGGVIHLLHDLLFQKQTDGAVRLVGLNDQVVPHALVVPAVGGQQGLGHLFHHIAGLNAFFLLNLMNGLKEFLAIHLIGVDLLLCHSLSHGVFPPKVKPAGTTVPARSPVW